MKLFHKIGETITQSVDFLLEKTRQAAYLNRLRVIIASEQETLENAYMALGQQYLTSLEGTQAPQDDETTAILTETIRAAKLRLKKAKARYAYVLRYGIPKTGIRAEMIDIDDIDENGQKISSDDTDEQDITIAYADPSANDNNDIIEAAIEETLREETSDTNH